MAIFAIADLHLSLSGEKPMDIFSGWQDYQTRLQNNWCRVVTEKDTVIIAGDVSWAMRLENSKQDFEFLHHLPGKKILIKGNHDYWWSTKAKMEKFLLQNGFDSIQILHNNSFLVEGIWICGSRSWLPEPQEEQDEKVMARELGRLSASLSSAGEGEKLVFLHYPPIYTTICAEQIIKTLHQFEIKRCFYGHLHGGAIRFAVQGKHDGIIYKLISADSLDFCPYKIYG